MIDRTVSHYKIIKKLGEGGMGEVYLAEDTELERKVALKFLPPDFGHNPEVLARFKREAKAAAALNHPNIVTVYEVGQHDGRPFIAMAYVEGELLSDVIKRDDLPVAKAIDIVIQICDGLGKAHEAGIVHRDIKPDNIFIDEDGRVKILDFGLATRTLDGATRVTEENSTVGTLYYMSPEQGRSGDVDQRSDIFSLGVVLYELIAGKPPFTGDHSAAVIHSTANDQPQPLSRYNNSATPELERIVSKVLAKNPGDRYQSVADLAVDLRNAAGQPVTASRSSRRSLRYAIPAAVVFVAIVLVLVLKPFKIEIAPDQPAVAGHNKLAIMYFENLADGNDPKRLGEIVTDLLITNLSRTEDLQVVSSQRLYDILKLKGREGAKVIDRSTSTDVAREAGATWMMLGSILQVEPTFVVSSQLIDMSTGNVVTSQRVTGAPGETIFDIVDRMTGETKGELNIPVERSVEAVSVADVTTSSLEAYQYYLEGEEYRAKIFGKEARESYKKAIAADSTFAMAYFKLAITGGQATFVESQAALNKAAEYAHKASPKEALYIKAFQHIFKGEAVDAIDVLNEIVDRYPDEKDAYHFLGQRYRDREDFANAAQAYERIIEIDPLDKLTYNQLAYTYRDLDQFDKSIWAINKYIEMAPDEPNPYDSRGDLYAYEGHVEEAIESYKKAAEIKPDFYPSVQKLGDMYLYQLDVEKAEEQYRKLVTSDQPSTRSWGRLYLAAVPIYRGEFQEGLEQLETGLSADKMEGYEQWGYLLKAFTKAQIYNALGDNDQSLAVASSCLEIGKTILPSGVPQFEQMFVVGHAVWLALNDRLEEAREVAGGLDMSVISKADNADLSREYYKLQGLLAYKGGDAASACAYYEKADSVSPSFDGRFLEGLAYLEAGRIDDAVTLYEEMVKKHDSQRILAAVWGPLTHFYLATAYEKAGQPQKAVEQYEQFLAIWENADADAPSVSDAQARVQALRASG